MFRNSTLELTNFDGIGYVSYEVTTKWYISISYNP